MATRRETKPVDCGGVVIGGGAPVSIQSMTNADTRDVPATLRQIDALAEAGCDIVRCAIPDAEAAEAFGRVKRASRLPLVADIHFDHRLALAALRAGADKIRINPGNIGGAEAVKAVVALAKERRVPIRVGVNAGSLERRLLEKHGGPTGAALAESALAQVAALESLEFFDIVVSMKSSDLRVNQEAHLAAAAGTPYPFHIGVTEAGFGLGGETKSAMGAGALLLAGIGDTLRVSLTGDPVREVLLASEILKAANLRAGCIRLIACPTCGRCRVDLESLARRVAARASELEKRRPRASSMSVAVMGCAVNGPGEASHADIGAACGDGRAVIFRRGAIVKTVPEEAVAAELIEGMEVIWESLI
ncbi:MAG: flavodoxin-dependent (E)-4-hydroxy-3-methylbut-2-enyl-diphosphate synthase [Clostridiales Family XIII bacterium]|jgi:(E)-4-hydroxy-3-methylbut-2-enyl-diphosphate synthase|nr:flavodoxin-dependent (E)-4-hydroxy-3-methylbut-2-enyl-diphosphate synthase [Clostridiales Family XIII bacterium]